MIKKNATYYIIDVSPSVTQKKSVVLGERNQTFGIADAFALEKNDVFVAERPQAHEPRQAPVVKLAADLRLAVIFQDHHGGLVLRQGRDLAHHLDVFNLVRGRRLDDLAGAVIQRLDDECAVVGVVERLRRLGSSTGTKDNRQSRNGERKGFFHVIKI